MFWNRNKEKHESSDEDDRRALEEMHKSLLMNGQEEPSDPVQVPSEEEEGMKDSMQVLPEEEGETYDVTHTSIEKEPEGTAHFNAAPEEDGVRPETVDWRPAPPNEETETFRKPEPSNEVPEDFRKPEMSNEGPEAFRKPEPSNEDLDPVWKSAFEKPGPQAYGPGPDGFAQNMQEPEEPKKKGSFWNKGKSGKKPAEPMPPEGQEIPGQENPDALRAKKIHRIRTYFIGAIVGILVIIIAFFTASYFIAQAKLRTVGINSEDCLGMDYITLKDQLSESGFTNIHTLAVNDLDYENLSQEGLVFFTVVDDTVTFNAEDSYPNDSDVIILYHAAKAVNCPYSMKDCEGIEAEEIAAAFEEAGFVNVSVEENPDLVFGLFHKEGDISSITVDGSQAETGASYRVDAEVIITYHAFKK